MMTIMMMMICTHSCLILPSVNQSINGSQWQLRRGIEPGTLWLARSDVDDDDAIRQCSQLEKIAVASSEGRPCLRSCLSKFYTHTR